MATQANADSSTPSSFGLQKNLSDGTILLVYLGLAFEGIASIVSSGIHWELLVTLALWLSGVSALSHFPFIARRMPKKVQEIDPFYLVAFLLLVIFVPVQGVLSMLEASHLSFATPLWVIAFNLSVAYILWRKTNPAP